MFDMPVKYFPKDVIKGKATKVGDKFTADFMGEREFVVTEFYGDMFFGKVVPEDEG